MKSCFQWFKDTNLKANHNRMVLTLFKNKVVSNGSKILIWKQITTRWNLLRTKASCFQWFKDTNLKANHNVLMNLYTMLIVVSNGSKILIWKQITTRLKLFVMLTRCFQWFKDTNLKANHNKMALILFKNRVVSNGSKILIWKQITTFCLRSTLKTLLFPMVQRY